MKGKNGIESDHNTIILDFTMNEAVKNGKNKKTDWNLRASSEKWAMFGDELEKRTPIAEAILLQTEKPFEDRYKRWFQELNGAAMGTIGKTTFKEGGKEKFSNEVKELRDQKKDIKRKITMAEDCDVRQQLVLKHKDIQERITVQIEKERKVIIKQKIVNMASDPSKNTFWKEKKKLSRDATIDHLTIKDANGLRQFEPEAIKYHTALYYENLYKKKYFSPLPYHKEVSTMIKLYKADDTHEDIVYNLVPSKMEVVEAICDKTNGKSTTDVKNEMLKRPGEKMSNFLYPLIERVWDEETIPSEWNTGHITSLWKGRNDKEKLENHRGITTSSAIGSIIEKLIDNRLEAHLPFTQAQGGGQRGASTCDHLLIIRSIIDTAKREKRQLFVTFYDVSKAYDNVDNMDMLKIIWDKGIRGKLWRIINNMNSDLRAKAKTKFGLTREIIMEIGGRQGSRNTGRLFSKLMDTLAESAIEEGDGFTLTRDLIIPMLLWIDDVTTFAVGDDKQWNILEKINKFAKYHKISWGREKCQVMRVGEHRADTETEWKIGEMPIKETKTYKYLGDVLSGSAH